MRIWRPLLNLSVHAELAAVDGVRVARIKLAFMLLVALVIAVAMKLVGVLLITALLIILAAAAQRFSRSPEQMALFATLIGAAAVVAGLLARCGSIPCRTVYRHRRDTAVPVGQLHRRH